MMTTAYKPAGALSSRFRSECFPLWPFGLLCILGCTAAWDVPRNSKSSHIAYASEKVSDDQRRIPPVLLNDPDLGTMAITCAVVANSFATKASENSLWSTTLGTLEVAGVGIGAVAASAAFASSNGSTTSAAQKTSIIGFAAGALIGAVDKAAAPETKSLHQARLAQTVGRMILLAATAAAEGDSFSPDGGCDCRADGGACDSVTPKQKAMKILAGCQDPSFINDGDVGMALPDEKTIKAALPEK